MRFRAAKLSAEDVGQRDRRRKTWSLPGRHAKKIGKFEYNVELSASPKFIDQLNDLPVKNVNGTIIYVRDVAFVHDGNPPQTNVVRVNGVPRSSDDDPCGRRGRPRRWTLSMGSRRLLPKDIQETLPAGLDLHAVGDQSIFVKAAVSGVIREERDRRGADRVDDPAVPRQLALDDPDHHDLDPIGGAVSPLRALSALGQTINVMTLGGLALAVGILVDDATVTIENINYHLELGKQIEPAIMDGARQIVVPAFVSLLCICIVFVPMFGLGGVAGYLFVPMAEAVVFAMIGSFILSRTLVPTLANYLLKEHRVLDHSTALEHDGPRSEHYGYRSPRLRGPHPNWRSVEPYPAQAVPARLRTSLHQGAQALPLPAAPGTRQHQRVSS